MSENVSMLTPPVISAADRILAAGNRVELVPVRGGVQVAEIRRRIVYRPGEGGQGECQERLKRGDT